MTFSIEKLAVLKIDDLPFNTRARTCFRNEYPPWTHVSQIYEHSRAELLRTPNFGFGTLAHVEEVLTKAGLPKLGMDFHKTMTAYVLPLSAGG